MTQDQLCAFAEQFFADAMKLRETKGNDYSRKENAFANFISSAASLGLSVPQVWAVYAKKHWDAIMRFCRDGFVESESLRSRLLDVVVYASILAAFVEETQDVQKAVLESEVQS